ncbi:AfsR/SARP family transcriptional regulator, partial [Kitasatospora cheerisanensis]|uniref:AfsR/SARP family transcriptional regulator n=1 Tax=Kitasatospora cheerisanensis TaxID=81942 RepID=UPI00142F94DE
MRIEVLGPVRALHPDGTPVDLGGPRHREVLARLVTAEGRTVATDTLVDDLWTDPPARAVGALRTFVAALRRALEPARPPRTPPHLIVTEGP